MTEYLFDPELLVSTRELFPPEIANDPWVVYHGTSSLFEDAIDRGGLGWTSESCDLQSLRRLMGIFQNLGWWGRSGGGGLVLKGYTLDFDFTENDQKPIYFAQLSPRSVLYASRDFAGGETARAVRHCMRDLQRYLEDEKLRQAHLSGDDDMSDRNRGQFKGMPRATLEWVKNEFDQLRGLRDLCEGMRTNYRYGLVYAVKFEKGDLPDLEYNQAMGLMAHVPVSSSRIVGKMRMMLQKDVEQWQPDVMRLIDREQDADSLLAQADRNGRQRNRTIVI